MAVQDDSDIVNETEASKDRILKCGPWYHWFQVLGIPRTATLDDVKKTYRKLCLFHHPDKSGGDTDTFKIIHKAYTEGVRVKIVSGSKQMQEKSKTRKSLAQAKGKVKIKVVSRVRAPGSEKVVKPKVKAVAKPKPTEVELAAMAPPAPLCEEFLRARREVTETLFAATQESSAQTSQTRARVKRPRAKPVAANASKAKLEAAITKWDTGSFKGKTMPDEVQTSAPQQAAAWLKEGSCVPVDVRSEKSSSLPGQSSFTYFQFLTAPDELASEVHRLREDGKRLLLFSQDGAPMGPCGLVGSLLLDVFGFDDDAVFRLEGGYDALKPLLGSGAESGVTLESALNARKVLLAAKKAQKEADTALARAKADLVIYDTACREHLEVLAKGAWASEEASREHLAQLSPLLKPLKLESSLVAMLTNAASKRPAERGPFDSVVFTELEKRFAEKIAALHGEVASAVTWVSEQAAAVKAAQAEVDETRKACSPRKASACSSPDAEKIAAEKVAELKANAEKKAKEKIAAEKAAAETVAAEKAAAEHAAEESSPSSGQGVKRRKWSSSSLQHGSGTLDEDEKKAAEHEEGEDAN